MDPSGGFNQHDEHSDDVVVRDDRACLACGYNLRGLPLVGNCPECGSDITRSLNRPLLRYASAAHVRTLHRGAVLVEACIAAGIAGMLVLGVFGKMLAGAISMSPAAFEFLSSLAWLLIGLAAALGWWWLSTPDPADELSGSDSRARRLLRWSLVAYGAAATGSFVASLAGINQLTAAPLAEGLALAAATIRVVQHLVSLYYVRSLASRIPSQRLVSAARSLTTFGIVITVPAAVMLLLALGIMFRWKMGLLNSLWCLTVPLAVCLLVWYLMYWSMIDRVRVQLLASLRAAERPSLPRRAPGPADVQPDS